MKIKYSITKKVLVIFLLLTIGIIMTSFIATITGANYLLRDTSLDYTYRLVEQVESVVIDYQNNMKNIGDAILKNSYIRDYIYHDSENIEDCINVLDFAVDTRDDITNIFLMKMESGNLEIISNDKNKNINEFANYKKTSWYKAIIEDGNDSIITSSYVQNLVEDQYNWVISQGISIKDENNRTIGVLLIDLNYSSIERILSNVMPDNHGYIYLLAEDGQIVYHPSQQLIFNKVKKEETTEVLKIHNDHFRKGNLIYVVVDSGLSKWKTIAVLDSTVIYRNTVINTIIFSVIAIVFIILSFYISYAFSNWFTKPIRHMTKSMQEVQKGDLSVRVDIKNQDEIGHLAQSFNVMTEQLGSLLERIVVEQEEKRNYELNALRAQINPHFLYNTLDSIIWMAECEKTEEVVEMTSALSKMLRASISHQKSGVTLHLEIQNAVNYLKIQKFRYANKLDYELDIDERLFNKKAAHLVLQPLIENAIYHGIKGKSGQGKITIRAYQQNDLMIIQVIDDGVGMTKDQIEKLLNKDSNAEGIGIYNVNRRITLIYGEEYGLTIESKVGEGTTNTITIPCKEMETGGDDLYENKYS